jgi:hypothetical protein
MSEKPDFEALRRDRNERQQASMKRLAEELDIPLASLTSNHNPDACYCACSTGGLCEHQWNGEGVEFDDGRGWSVTCSRCNCTAMGHDMRALP